VLPWPDPAIETVGPTLERLAQIPNRTLTERELALFAGLRFCDALARGDGSLAAELIEAVGYQPLPLEGDLPETPTKALLPGMVRDSMQGRVTTSLSGTPLRRFAVHDYRSLAARFPAIATWMLPAEDYAVVIEPSPETPGWVSKRGCIVIRMRARKPAIMGGNLLEVWPAAPAETPSAPTIAPSSPDSPAGPPPSRPRREIG
jgi:hypothetical protein